MQYLNERFRKLRLEAIPLDVPVSIGARRKIELAIQSLQHTAQQDCYDRNDEECTCTPCMARFQIQQLKSILEVKHESLHPDRLNNLAEAIYLRRWQKLNEAQPGTDFGRHVLELILSPTRRIPGERNWIGEPPSYIPPVSQRDAQVAATVIQWLGTSCGRGFVHDAEQEIRNKNAIGQMFTLGPVFKVGEAFSEIEALARSVASLICPADHESYTTLVNHLTRAIQQAAEYLNARGC